MTLGLFLPIFLILLLTVYLSCHVHLFCENSLLWIGSGTPPIHSHSHWYRMYRSNCNKTGDGFQWWLIQKHLRAIIQNNSDGCRIANNTLDQQLLTANLLNGNSSTVHFAYLLLIIVWFSVWLHHMLYLPDWLYAFPIMSRCIFSVFFFSFLVNW